jgi:hypothetical protein
MEHKRLSSEKDLAMTYWHATEAFGVDAVNIVLGQGKWSETHPDTVQGTLSSDIRLRNRTVLPAEIVYEIASRPECIYDFFADPDGAHLYASLRDQPLIRPFDTSQAERIPTHEALVRYGAYCLYKAADAGVGLRGE